MEVWHPFDPLTNTGSLPYCWTFLRNPPNDEYCGVVTAAIMTKATVLFILSSGLDMWFRMIFLCYCSCDLDEPESIHVVDISTVVSERYISFHSSPPAAVTE
jgi:hypothetical protein